MSDEKELADEGSNEGAGSARPESARDGAAPGPTQGGGDGGQDGNQGSGELPLWKNPAYRFVFLFLVYLGCLALAYPKFRERYAGAVDVLARFTAHAEYWVFSIFTRHTYVSDKVVSYKGFAVNIIEECTGVYEVLIFSAAVLAFPTSWQNKGVGLGLGVPLLYLFNVLRIGVLMLVGKYQPEYFDFMHLYFWQATLILMITSVWLLWITQVVNRDWSRSPSGP